MEKWMGVTKRMKNVDQYGKVIGSNEVQRKCGLVYGEVDGVMRYMCKELYVGILTNSCRS